MTVELLLELFCAVTSRLKIGIDLVSLFQVVGDGFVDLREGERRKVLANFFGVAPSQKEWITLSRDTRVPAIRQVPCGVQVSKSGRSRSGFIQAILDQPLLEGK